MFVQRCYSSFTEDKNKTEANEALSFESSWLKVLFWETYHGGEGEERESQRATICWVHTVYPKIAGKYEFRSHEFKRGSTKVVGMQSFGPVIAALKNLYDKVIIVRY